MAIIFLKRWCGNIELPLRIWGTPPPPPQAGRAEFLSCNWTFTALAILIRTWSEVWPRAMTWLYYITVTLTCTVAFPCRWFKDSSLLVFHLCNMWKIIEKCHHNQKLVGISTGPLIWLIQSVWLLNIYIFFID